MLIFDALLLVLFAIIAYQDFRQREVVWYVFPIIFVVIVLKALNEIAFPELVNYFGINVLFVTLQMAVLFMFYAIKNRRFVNIIDRYIGLGDLILFVLLCASFSPILFGLFFITSLILLTIVFIIVQLTHSKNNNAGRPTVPLAGGLSVSYIVVIIAGFFITDFNMYNDNFIGGYFIGK